MIFFLFFWTDSIVSVKSFGWVCALKANHAVSVNSESSNLCPSQISAHNPNLIYLMVCGKNSHAKPFKLVLWNMDKVGKCSRHNHSHMF